jgi:hypothetical protein
MSQQFSLLSHSLFWALEVAMIKNLKNKKKIKKKKEVKYLIPLRVSALYFLPLEFYLDHMRYL